MKTRSGFVSNSSSSSFVIIANREMFVKKLNESPDYVKHVVKMFSKTSTIDGKSIVYAFGVVSSEDEIYDFDGEIPNSPSGDWEMTTDEVMLKFTGLFAKGEAIIDWECA